MMHRKLGNRHASLNTRLISEGRRNNMDPPSTATEAAPPQRRWRAPRLVEWTLHFTICFVVLSFLTLEPIARNSVQTHDGKFDDRPGITSYGFISSYDRETLTQLEKTKEIWLRQDKEKQAVLEKKVSMLSKTVILLCIWGRSNIQY